MTKQKFMKAWTAHIKEMERLTFSCPANGELQREIEAEMQTMYNLLQRVADQDAELREGEA